MIGMITLLTTSVTSESTIALGVGYGIGIVGAICAKNKEY